MDGIDAVDQAWARVERWYAATGHPEALAPGADPAAVDRAESELGLTLPVELRASLLRHDGTSDGGWVWGELLSVAGIVAEVRIWRELLDDGTFDPQAEDDFGTPAGALQPGWWHRGWISLDADGGGNGHVVDSAPGPRGSPGQVFYMDHEMGPNGPSHTGVAAYLREAAERLEADRHTWADDWLESLD